MALSVGMGFFILKYRVLFFSSLGMREGFFITGNAPLHNVI